MSFTRRFPGRHIINLKDEIDRFYDEFFGGRSEENESTRGISPRVDIEETEQAFILSAEMPGLDKDDVKITFKEGNISVSGEKKDESNIKERHFHRQERNYGPFSRSFSIPGQIQAEKIEATFSNGILTVVMPKAEESKAKEIKIKVN